MDTTPRIAAYIIYGIACTVAMWIGIIDEFNDFFYVILLPYFAIFIAEFLNPHITSKIDFYRHRPKSQSQQDK